MKRFYRCAFCITVGFSLVMMGCAQEPKQELAIARAALDSAKAVQAEKYAARDFAALQDSLNAAIAEIQKQKVSSMLSRNYNKAKVALISVTALAGPLKAKAAGELAKAKAEADNAIAKLNSSIADAKFLLGKLSKNTKIKAKVEAKKKALAAVETTVAAIQKLRADGDFSAAIDKANAGVAKVESMKEKIKTMSVKYSKAKSRRRR